MDLNPGPHGRESMVLSTEPRQLAMKHTNLRNVFFLHEYSFSSQGNNVDEKGVYFYITAIDFKTVLYLKQDVKHDYQSSESRKQFIHVLN